MKILLLCSLTILPHLRGQMPASAQEINTEACRVRNASDPAQKPVLGDWGFETQFVDQDVGPGDDFYRYAVGGWLKHTQLPKGRSVWGMFDTVQRRTAQQIADIIRSDVHAGAHIDKEQQLIRALYNGYLDSEAIERRGLIPIKREMHLLKSLKTHADVARLMGQWGQASLVTITLTPDQGDTSRLLLALGQGGLGLPGRDYYLKPDEPFVTYRNAYHRYVADTLRSAGVIDPTRKASELVALETQLATVEWNPEQLRDTKLNNRVLSLPELGLYAPGFDWKGFLSIRNVGFEKTVVLQADTALKAKAQVFSATDVKVWSTYLLFRWIENHASVLPRAISENKFSFYSGVLNGVTVKRPREELAIDYVNLLMGDLVGKLYVQRYFSEASLTLMKEMISDLRLVFSDRIDHVSWLDENTRKEAQKKLARLTVRIGYPDHWRSYQRVVIRADDPVGNQDRLAQFDWDHTREVLARPMTSHEWYQNPQTVDATSSKFYNSIEFPAGILQSPFFDPNADLAVNFGAIGAIIGHEMGHNFDDQGSQFDERGNHRDWWTTETRKRFDLLTGQLAVQYDAYSSVPGMHVNGKQTLGENIGDLTGVVVAYDAYHRYIKQHCRKPVPTIDGFSGDQRFFLSWAQVWRCVYTPQAARGELIQGYHSPAEFRVNGVVKNVIGWYDAFKVQPEQQMYLPPQKRVAIW